MKVSHEQHCGFNIHPYYQVSPATPLHSLSISVVRCDRVMTGLLCAYCLPHVCAKIVALKHFLLMIIFNCFDLY